MRRFIAIALLVCFVCACQSTNCDLSAAKKRMGDKDFQGALECYNVLIDSVLAPASDLLVALNDRALIQYILAKEKQDISLAEKAVEDWTRYFELVSVPNTSNLVRAYFGCGLLGLQRKEEALVQFDKACADAPDGQAMCQWAKAVREGSDISNVCKFDDIRKQHDLYGDK